MFDKFTNWKKPGSYGTSTTWSTNKGRRGAGSSNAQYPSNVGRASYNAVQYAGLRANNFVVGSRVRQSAQRYPYAQGRVGQKRTAPVGTYNRRAGKVMTTATIADIARRAISDNKEQKFLTVGYQGHELLHNKWSKGPKIVISPLSNGAGKGLSEYTAHTNMLQQIVLATDGSNRRMQRAHAKIEAQVLRLNFTFKTKSHAAQTKYRVIVYSTPHNSAFNNKGDDDSIPPPQITENPDASVNPKSSGGIPKTHAAGIYGINHFACAIDQTVEGVKVLEDCIISDPTPPQLHKAFGHAGAAATGSVAGGDYIPAMAPVGDGVMVKDSDFDYQIEVKLNQEIEYLTSDTMFGKSGAGTNIHVAILAYNPSEHVSINGLADPARAAILYDPVSGINKFVTPEGTKACALLDCRYTLFFKEMGGA